MQGSGKKIIFKNNCVISKLSFIKERNLVKRSSGNRRFQLCGRQLHQMLAVVCNGGRGKRSAKETEETLGNYKLM